MLKKIDWKRADGRVKAKIIVCQEKISIKRVDERRKARKPIK